MRLALRTADPLAHRGRALRQRLPLFDKFDLDRAIGWVELQAQVSRQATPRVVLPQKDSSECSRCGYGIARAKPPERRPMCQSEASGVHVPWRRFSRNYEPTA